MGETFIVLVHMLKPLSAQDEFVRRAGRRNLLEEQSWRAGESGSMSSCKYDGALSLTHFLFLNKLLFIDMECVFDTFLRRMIRILKEFGNKQATNGIVFRLMSLYFTSF